MLVTLATHTAWSPRAGFAEPKLSLTPRGGVGETCPLPVVPWMELPRDDSRLSLLRGAGGGD